MWNKLLILLGIRKKPKTATEKLRDILWNVDNGVLDLVWGPELDFKPIVFKCNCKFNKDDYRAYRPEEKDEGS
jgi:hypothetical protein